MSYDIGISRNSVCSTNSCIRQIRICLRAKTSPWSAELIAAIEDARATPLTCETAASQRKPKQPDAPDSSIKTLRAVHGRPERSDSNFREARECVAQVHDLLQIAGRSLPAVPSWEILPPEQTDASSPADFQTLRIKSRSASAGRKDINDSPPPFRGGLSGASSPLRSSFGSWIVFRTNAFPHCLA